MKLGYSNRRNDAMTLTEVLVVVIVIAVLIFMILPTLMLPQRRVAKINCRSNVRQIEIGFRIWEGDHGDKYPMQVSSAEGGASELANKGDVVAIFQVMSNELATPKVLICPADTNGCYADNFCVNFGRTNVSYFVGLDATEENTNSILVGDDNFAIKGEPVKPGVYELTSTTPVAWTSERHHFSGYIVLAGGSWSTPTNSELAGVIIKQYAGPSGFTNRFRIAIP